MPKLPNLTGKQLLSALSSLGFQVIRTRGSHYFARHPDGRATVVPAHAGETIGPGLLSRILRDCDISKADLEKAL
jgi:predicted RNA binding protein YcfA (HicA-like mRNA interferase family)